MYKELNILRLKHKGEQWTKQELWELIERYSETRA